jgi:cystathionine beta-lyase
MDERTRLIRDATRKPGRRRPVNPPIERATTLINARAADLRDGDLGPTYGIDGLGVHRALRDALCELEHAHEAFLVPTGLAAVTVAVLACVTPGDEILAVDACYGPTRRFLDRYLKRQGVSARYYPSRASAEEVLALAGERTRLILMESPGSVTFEVQDVPGIARLARERRILTLVDNTWAAGLFFQPLDHGVDLSVQALSKYVAGHSDVFGGSIAVADDSLTRRVWTVIEDLGWFTSPDDAWLTLRGLRTLAVRAPRHGESALQVAQWLERQPEVASVLYPPLPSHPDHGLWKRDFSGATGLMGMVMRRGSQEAAEAMLDALELFGLGFSWGGFESLATFEDPQLVHRQHAKTPEGPLIRLHVGLEAPEDLIADLRRGLDVYAAHGG